MLYSDLVWVVFVPCLGLCLAWAQTFQNPLIKEYTVNHIKDPTMI